ncbi:MAG: hypothetical protein LBB54_04445 [Cellulomonadaceae bacterium]|jgi:hypothetical protein|nr:hypothetical protein [Cellulomonadaceae bacterium]
MATAQLDRTTMAVRVATRDRIKEHVTAEETTIDVFLTRLLDEHDERQFWEQMEATSADDYEAAAREDGVWPGDYDYSMEAERA